MTKIRFGSHVVDVTHLDKVLFPDDNITKSDLINYYHQISGTMLPYLKDRPVTMQRFPDGITKEGFYHKDVPDYFPDWIKRARVEKEDGSIEQIICEDPATLAYLATQACITPHIWLSRIDKPHYPDRMILDFDPPHAEGSHFELVRTTAEHARDLLISLGLNPLVMTTGSRGLHLVVSLDRSADFSFVRTFAHDLARLLVSKYPDRLTVEPRKDKRGNRLFIDWLRNAYAQLSVAPYAVRPKHGAPVAAPLDWSELDDMQDSGLPAQRYNIRNIFERLSKTGDPWSKIDRLAASLDEPRRCLDDLLKKS